jgi:phage pi2 protein 07
MEDTYHENKSLKFKNLSGWVVSDFRTRKITKINKVLSQMLKGSIYKENVTKQS